MHATLILLFVALFVLPSCADPAPRPPGASGGCARVGCPPGERCEADGTCVPEGSGGGGPGLNECDASDDCFDEPPTQVLALWWDGGQNRQPRICTVPQAGCPGGGCTVPTGCLPAADGLPGSFACDLDEQCASGRCVDTGAVELCFRACASDADCPGDLDGSGAGFRCGEVEQRGVLLRSCLPADPALPAATLCRRDCDCRPGAPEPCEPAGPGEPTCRLVGKSEPSLSAIPECEVPPEGELRPTGSRCLEDPESCTGGGCGWSCNTPSANGVLHLCDAGPSRCTNVCTKDGDCPPRLACGTGRDAERIGTWPTPGDEFGRDITYCQLPGDGCWDERDCCPVPDGAGGCLQGWTATPRRCAVVLLGRAPELLTQCVPIDPARLPPGSCCAAHAECDSSLCVPGRAGTACAASGVCTVPCDADPAGLPGAGDEHDLCASEGLGLALDGATCLPFDYELEAGTPGGPVITLNVCR